MWQCGSVAVWKFGSVWQADEAMHTSVNRATSINSKARAGSEVATLQCAVCSEYCTVCSVQCAVSIVQRAVYSVQCAVGCVLCVVCSR